MKKSRILACAASAILSTLFLAAPAAKAQSSAPSSVPTGCVHYGPAGNRFIDNTVRSRDDVMKDIQEALRQPTALGPVDACLAGQLRNLSAAAYQRLATRSPSTFAPLPPQSSAAQSLKAAAPPGLPASAGAPFPFRYSYLNLNPFTPSGFFPDFFIAIGIADDNRVVGIIFDNDFNGYVAVYDNGFVKVLAKGQPSAVSPLGVIGGNANIDLNTGLGQAAIFHDNGVELVPRVTGEVDSYVIAINDLGVAIIQSLDENFNASYATYANGQRRPLNFSVGGSFTIKALNNLGTVVGVHDDIGVPSQGFRHNLLTGQTTLLAPLPGDPYAWATDINDQGDIVGFSFGPAAEHVGIFNAVGNFETYFTQGTPDFPTISRNLLITRTRLIVITATNDQQSYPVPKKGIRVPLVGLIDYDPTTEGPPSSVVGITKFNAMAGSNTGASFLIKPKVGK